MTSTGPIGNKHKPSRKLVSRPGHKDLADHGGTKETTPVKAVADPEANNSQIFLRISLEIADAVVLGCRERTSRPKSSWDCVRC